MSNLLEEMESDVTTPTIGDNSLKEMADLCAEQASLEEEIRQLEEQLKAKAKAARKLSQEIIPAKMSELGLESLTLKDGSSVKVKQLVQASIPVRYREEAYEWLRENGLGDLIKNEVTVAFGRSEDNKAQQYAVLAQGQGYEPIQKLKVEPMTLKALVRERVEAGLDMPSDLFNLFTSNRTKITRNK